MADWRCLTAAEQSMVRSLGHDSEPMMVNRTGDGQWLFLDMKSRTELIVSLDKRGKPRGTVWEPEIKPPNRPEMQDPKCITQGDRPVDADVCGAGNGRDGTSIMDLSYI